MKSNSKYLAIKVDGFKHWLWFDRKKVVRGNATFEGEEGWGDGGALINSITVDENLIRGEIESDTLQYI